ncbi:thyroid adenoma-associated protein [Lasius niger]|uniref:Thyroid adenoma-associated protein n=1 Tax=Lasius niger TaxID=67767 RepID=A0A0J7LAA9_LASNI|nr:thyroid adenoma-associated protein [Lasius niger]
MEYVPFVKKALKRLKDGLAVMQRQLTQEENMRNRHKEQNSLTETYENALALSYKTSEQIERDIQDYTIFFVNLREICVNNLALFRHSQLGDMVKNYIADGLIVAFRNYDSKTWAILEILTRLPSVQLLKSDVTEFLNSTDWILKGLEKRTNGFGCFPIATVYIDILHELFNLDKNM